MNENNSIDEFRPSLGDIFVWETIIGSDGRPRVKFLNNASRAIEKEILCEGRLQNLILSSFESGGTKFTFQIGKSVFSFDITPLENSLESKHAICAAADISEFEKIEKASKKLDTKYKMLVEDAPVGIFKISPDGEIRESNGEFRNMFDLYEVGAALNIFDLFVGEDEIPAFSREELTDFGTRVFEKKVKNAEGVFAWLRIKFKEIKAADGSTKSIIGFIEDVNWEKSAEITNKIVTAKLKMITDHMVDLIVETDVHGKIVFVNRGAGEMLGYARQELIGKDFWSLVCPDYQSEMIKLFDLSKHGKSPRFEFEMRAKDGGIVWIEGSGRPLYDVNENFSGTIVSGRDVTKRKIAEEALRQSEERYRSITGILTDCADCSLIFEDGSLVREWFTFNPETFLQYPLPDFNSLNDWKKIIVPDDRAIFDERLRMAMEGESSAFELRFRDLNGDDRWFLMNVTPEINPFTGRAFRIYFAMKDAGARKKAEAVLKETNEKLSALNAAKDKFFSIIAHDLRNPISVFHSLSTLLREELESLTIGELGELTEQMSLAAENLYKLLNDLLLWARSQSGMLSFDPEEAPLDELIARTLYDYAQSAERKKISLNVDTPPELKVKADVPMLMNILSNLISNAVKFTPTGGNISIKAFKTRTGVEVSVEDDGVGILNSEMENLFKIERSQSARGTDNEPGTGLGLILCKEFVTRHGGTIEVVKAPIKGSIFRFVLPD